MWLGLVCCSSLIRTLITVCSASFHLLLLEFDMLELRPQPINNKSLKYQGLERPNLLVLFYQLRFGCRMTFPTLCLTQERWMGSRVQSTVGCFSELYFLIFSVVQVIVRLRKQFINNFVFPTWACAAGFNKNAKKYIKCILRRNTFLNQKVCELVESGERLLFPSLGFPTCFAVSSYFLRRSWANAKF